SEDANKILNNDAVCPICDQVLSKSLMRAVDVNPGDEWINMAMTGLSPQVLMKSAYRSVMFYIGQKELEMQYKMNKIVGQCRQKCEVMQAKFTEKLEEVHTAYQKMAKRQKRKLDEMYDQLRSEYESTKRSAIQPVNNFFPRNEPDLFSSMGNMMDGRDPLRQDPTVVLTPETPGRREEVWPSTARQKSSNSGAFEVSGGSPAQIAKVPADAGIRRPARPSFGAGVSNPSAALRNLILSPMKRPQMSRSRPHMFT
ncbi:E3 ubiquitin-protein ligase CCNB1IP, partial [Ananas comosus]